MGGVAIPHANVYHIDREHLLCGHAGYRRS
jgi:hypothetical protein